MDLSKIGLGTWVIGGPYEFGWGPTDDDESRRVITTAIDSGINWLDTAPAYGYGHAEAIIGQTLQGMSELPKVFTKCGRVWDSNGKVTSDLRPHSIRNQWAESAKRLKVDNIDLYQIHRPDTVTGTPIEESWATLAQMKQEGKVNAIGLSNVTADQFVQCNNVHPVDSVQPFVNLLRPGDRQLREIASQTGAIVITYSPMESGLLTDSFDASRVAQLSDDDWRKKSPRFGPDGLARAHSVVHTLQQVGARHGYTVPDLAIAWVLRQAGVTGVIVGARKSAQIAAWIDAPKATISEAEWEEIELAAGVHHE